MTTGSGGFTSANGGSLIYSPAIPDGTSSYEVRMTLSLTQSGGDYLSYLHASSNSFIELAAGTYYATWIQNPTFSNGACSAYLNVYKSVNGSGTMLAQSPIPCHNGMTVRSVITDAGILVVYIDDVYYYYPPDTTITSGKPGLGVGNAPAGNSISSVQFGPSDRTAPSPVNAQTIATSVFPNEVDMHWQPASDGTSGTGIATY